LYFRTKEFDGVIHPETSLWFDSFKDDVDPIVSLSPKWVALKSLLNDGQGEFGHVVKN
jgi:hypothetical protein